MMFSKHNGYSADGRRLLHKGGDGGAKAAAKAEDDRQARITSAVSTINGVFDNPTRNDLYDEQEKAVYDINALDVNRQYTDAEQSNRFGLARSGLMGGSTDIDSNAELQRKTNEGLMKAAGLGDAAAADLKTADERSRQSLISMAQSGIDTGTAQSMALRNLDATAQSAAGARAGSSLSGLFDNMSNAYLTRQYVNGTNAGMSNNWQQSYPNLSAGSGGSNGSVIK